MLLLLDTPIAFELRKARAGGAEAGLTAWAAGVARERLFLSAISLMELEVAATEAARRDKAAAVPSALTGPGAGRGLHT